MLEKKVRNDVRKVQLDILIKLDDICKKYGLRYYLAFGTCLGALRHNGFIPWDDDIDVLMPYADAKRLVHLQNEFGDKYFVEGKESDPEYGSIAMRIVDEDTTCIEKRTLGKKIHKGIYVDVYPYYECSSNKIIRFIDILRANLLRILLYNEPPRTHGIMVELVSKIILKIFSGKRRIEKIKELEDRLVSVKGNEILDYHGEDITLLTAISYPKQWFDVPKQLKFEGMYFYGPTEPEKYMEKRYGDYMKLPPEENRIFRHDCIVIDPYKSYKEYEGDK